MPYLYQRVPHFPLWVAHFALSVPWSCNLCPTKSQSYRHRGVVVNLCIDSRVYRTPLSMSYASWSYMYTSPLVVHATICQNICRNTRCNIIRSQRRQGTVHTACKLTLWQLPSSLDFWHRPWYDTLGMSQATLGKPASENCCNHTKNIGAQHLRWCDLFSRYENCFIWLLLLIEQHTVYGVFCFHPIIHVCHLHQSRSIYIYIKVHLLYISNNIYITRTWMSLMDSPFSGIAIKISSRIFCLLGTGV